MAEPGARVSDVIFLFTDGRGTGPLRCPCVRGPSTPGGVFRRRGDQRRGARQRGAGADVPDRRRQRRAGARPRPQRAARGGQLAQPGHLPADAQRHRSLRVAAADAVAELRQHRRLRALPRAHGHRGERRRAHDPARAGSQVLGSRARSSPKRCLCLKGAGRGVFQCGADLTVRYPGAYEGSRWPSRRRCWSSRSSWWGTGAAPWRVGGAVAGLLSVIGARRGQRVGERTLLWGLAVRLHPEYRLLAAASPAR